MVILKTIEQNLSQNSLEIKKYKAPTINFFHDFAFFVTSILMKKSQCTSCYLGLNAENSQLDRLDSWYKKITFTEP